MLDKAVAVLLKPKTIATSKNVAKKEVCILLTPYKAFVEIKARTNNQLQRNYGV